ncbi:MAG: NAD-dependent epimerase, partial [Bosea sp.]|nr:NAD-dependent epimerase [Bosea sp. (in: a-proteobacteria)]
MHVLISGAAGMIGQRLAARIAREGACAGKPLTRLTLTDVVAPPRPPGFDGPVAARTEDSSSAAVAAELAA